MNKKYDITWIMQVYLGDYNGSPKDHSKKFKRAVKSFLNMKDPATQLIIASDGCHLAHEIYFSDFSKFDNIKYVFMEKTSPKLRDPWEDDDLVEYNRVGMRELARKLVEGDIVTYLDSDDMLLPNASQIIRSKWEKANQIQEIDWMVNTLWYDNEKINNYIENTNYHHEKYGFGNYKTFGNSIKIKGLRGKWIETGLDAENKVAMYAFNYIHRTSNSAVWRDTLSGLKNGQLADSSFWKKLRSSGRGLIMKDKYYVRCRYPNIWEY